VSFSDERDHAEEQANRAEMQEQDHCIRCMPTRDPWTGHEEDDVDCVHCPCCCECLACEYGPRDGMPLTAEQRAPIAAFEATDGELARAAADADREPADPDFDDVPPNAGSAS
jgi:hypothetical protein